VKVIYPSIEQNQSGSVLKVMSGILAVVALADLYDYYNKKSTSKKKIDIHDYSGDSIPPIQEQTGKIKPANQEYKTWFTGAIRL